MSEVVAYFTAEARHLDPALADKIIKTAAAEAFKCYLRAKGWEIRPANRRQGPLIGSFPRRVAVFFVPPGSRFPDAGVEGKDFFSHRSLFEALLETEAGNRVLTGVSSEEAGEMVLESIFAEAWRCLEEAGGWKVDCGDDLATIEYAPAGESRPLSVFKGKREFLRACYSIATTRGLPPLPVAALRAEDTLEERSEALWCKMTSPRYNYTWAYQIDGRPYIVPREMRDLEEAVRDETAFESGSHLVSCFLGGASSAPAAISASASHSPLCSPSILPASRALSSSLGPPRPPLEEKVSHRNVLAATLGRGPRCYEASSCPALPVADPRSASRPSSTQPSAETGRAGVSRGASGEGRPSRGTPGAGIIDISQGDHALSIDDDWPRFVEVLPRHGFGYAYRTSRSDANGGVALLLPQHAGKNVESWMVEGRDWFRNKEQIVPYIQARYKTSHHRTDYQSPRGARALNRKMRNATSASKIAGAGVASSCDSRDAKENIDFSSTSTLSSTAGPPASSWTATMNAASASSRNTRFQKRKAGRMRNVFELERDEKDGAEEVAQGPMVKKESGARKAVGNKKQKLGGRTGTAENDGDGEEEGKVGVGKAKPTTRAHKKREKALDGRRDGGGMRTHRLKVEVPGCQKGLSKAKGKQSRARGSPEGGDASDYRYYIDMSENENWVYRYLKDWHGWCTKSGFRKQDGTDNGYRYCTPRYSEAHQEEGKHWFRSLADVKKYVSRHVEAGCLPFASILNDSESTGGGSPSVGGAAVAMTAEKEGMEEGEGEEGRSSAEVTGFESLEEMTHKLVTYHGFVTEGRKLIPPGGSARGQRGEDYLEGLDDLQAYVLEKIQGLPPTQDNPSFNASSSRNWGPMGRVGASPYVGEPDMGNGKAGQGMGAGRDKGKRGPGRPSSNKAVVARPSEGNGRANGGDGLSDEIGKVLQPTDLLDQTVLLQKLLRHYGWKKQWPEARSLIQEYIYVPPGGKRPSAGGVAGVDFAISFEHLRQLVVRKYFKGEDLLTEHAVPVVEEIDLDLTKERHFSMIRAGREKNGEEEEEEDDDEDEDEEDDDEEEQEEEEEADVEERERAEGKVGGVEGETWSGQREDCMETDLHPALSEDQERREERDTEERTEEMSPEPGTSRDERTKGHIRGVAGEKDAHDQSQPTESGEGKTYSSPQSPLSGAREEVLHSHARSNSRLEGHFSVLAPGEWFQRDHLVAWLRDGKTFNAALDVLMKTHEWQVLPSQENFTSTSGKFYVAPGGRTPWEGGTHGVDYLMDHEELIEYVTNGFGLRTNQFAPITAALRPDRLYRKIISPLHDRSRHSTRSGRTYTPIPSAEPASTQMEESPSALRLDGEVEEEEEGRGRERCGDTITGPFIEHAGKQAAGGERGDKEASGGVGDRVGGGGLRGNTRDSLRGDSKGAGRLFSSSFPSLDTDAEVASPAGGGDVCQGPGRPEDEESARRLSTGSVHGPGSSLSYQTPSLSRSTAKRKCLEKSAGALASAVSSVPFLTPMEVDRYTYSVLKAKRWTLALRPPAPSSSNDAMYELIPPQEEGLPTRPFNSEKDALLWARDEGGLVSSQELQTHAEACPYQPIIAEMEVARSRLGQAGSGDCHVSAVREVESRRLLDFYMAYLLEPTGAWLRVGGLPGTGKTLAVQHSEALLAHALASRGINARPTFVRLNCAAYSAPKSFLEALAAQLHLTGGTGSFASASSRRMSLGAVREPLTEDALWAKLEERLRWVKRPDMNGRGSGGTLSDVLSSPLIKSMTSWFRGGGSGAATKAAVETTRKVSEEQEAASGDRRLDSSVVKANELVGRTVVLVLDELDQFIATNRETIGCVARLISNVIMVAGSRALLVTVSNTIDDHTALGALWSKAKTTAGRSPACWKDYAGHDEDRALAAGVGEEKLEPIIFRPFQDAELVQILKVCVGDTFQAPALAMIAKRVTSSRGDARVAVDTCRRALERHVRTLDAKAKAWCPASLMEGEKDNGDKSMEVRDSERQVTAVEANAASKEMDVDVGKDIGKLPQHARFLLLVLLHMTTTRGGGKGGNQVKLADLQNEYTQQAKAILGASQLGASSNFEDNLEWIDENGLVEKGKGGKAKVVSPKVDWATVLPKLTVQDKTHFKALLPK